MIGVATPGVVAEVPDDLAPLYFAVEKLIDYSVSGDKDVSLTVPWLGLLGNHSITAPATPGPWPAFVLGSFSYFLENGFVEVSSVFP